MAVFDQATEQLAFTKTAVDALITGLKDSGIAEELGDKQLFNVRYTNQNVFKSAGKNVA